MSSFQSVRRGKLLLKGDVPLESLKDKKKAKKKRKKVESQDEKHVKVSEEEEGGEDSKIEDQQLEGTEKGKEKGKKIVELDSGIGHAPDGKKSKKYEELFPVETKRFGFVQPETVQTREEALLQRAKKKADRYCK